MRKRHEKKERCHAKKRGLLLICKASSLVDTLHTRRGGFGFLVFHPLVGGYIRQLGLSVPLPPLLLPLGRNGEMYQK